MKKVFMVSAMAAMMVAAVSCGCNNTAEQVAEEAAEAVEQVCDSAKACCADSTAATVVENLEEVAE